MTLFIDENCIADLVGMDDALEAVEEVFGELGRGNVINVPRSRRRGRAASPCLMMNAFCACVNFDAFIVLRSDPSLGKQRGKL